MLQSIATQFCFAGLSILLNVYAIALMPSGEAVTFVTAFALAQSYAPVHNCMIGLTLASLAPRLSETRVKSYGALTWMWTQRLAFFHGAALFIAWALWPTAGDILVALSLFLFALAAGIGNFLRQWLFQQLRFNRVMRIDAVSLIVAVGAISGNHLFTESTLSTSALLFIGACARFCGFVYGYSLLPKSSKPERRMSGGFWGLHKREAKKLIFFTFANYLRQNLVYVFMAAVVKPDAILLLRSADLMLLPMRQISGGATAFLVPFLSRARAVTASTWAQTLLLCAAMGGIFALICIGGGSALAHLLPARFATALIQGGWLIAFLYITHFVAAGALALLRGTFQFSQLARSSFVATVLGVIGLLAIIALTDEWRYGLFGFICIDLMFVALVLRTKIFQEGTSAR